ncbi:unnamed protein product [Schistosoma spindalis]|nr:unnamed protein product [Schistosoma spindale]
MILMCLLYLVCVLIMIVCVFVGLANEAAARSRPMEKRGEIDNTKSKILDNYKKNGVRLNDILNFAKAFIP